MVTEVAAANLRGQRSWLVTLTFAPWARFVMELKVRERLGETVWRDLSREEVDVQTLQAVQREVTLYLKRLREKAGVGFRYVSVVERHKDGYPHVHLLLHEKTEPIRHRDISSAWHCGFSNAKLVEDLTGAARYVAKYLTKSAIARVRASIDYGTPPECALSEVDECRRGNEARPTLNEPTFDVTARGASQSAGNGPAVWRAEEAFGTGET